MRVAEAENPGLTHEERARSAWRKIGWRVKLPVLSWAENEEIIALIASEIASAAELARRGQ